MADEKSDLNKLSTISLSVDHAHAIQYMPQQPQVQYSPNAPDEEAVKIEPPKESLDTEVACNTFFCKAVTIWRIINVILIITGAILGGVFFNIPHLFPVSITGLVVCSLFYLIYLIDVFAFNHNCRAMTRVGDASDLHTHVNQLRSEAADVIFRMECYHYERRTTRVSAGKARTRTQTRTVKVVTWRGQQPMEYAQVWDASPKLEIEEYRNTRVKFHKNYTFADAQSEANFARQKDFFVLNNCTRDVHYTLDVSLELQGFMDTAIASSPEAVKSPPWYMNPGLYVMAVFFLLELPFSFYMKKMCPKVDYTYIKVFRC